MITRVNHVLIGKKTNTTAPDVNNLSVGDIAVFDQNMKITDGTYADTLFIGVCTGKNGDKSIMKYSSPIKLLAGAKYVSNTYTPPVQEKVVIDLTNASVTVGHRYVLRILYRDIEPATIQFTHTYECIATTENVGDLASMLAAKINKHVNRRANAAVEGNVITLTAMEKTDNDGVNSINKYSIVSMDVCLYTTIPGASLSNQPELVTGVNIEKTPGNPGKGYWKQVRDAESNAMGYLGHVFTGAYPSMEQERMVTKDATYNCVTVEWDNSYVSSDNQYIKTTPLTVEIYCEGELSKITEILDTFLN